MPEEITLEDGSKREVLTEEEQKNLQAGHDANAAKKEALAERERELAETKEKLTKLENKDFNFKKLRDMNEEEKGKLTEAEKALMNKQEELEENQKKFQTSVEEGNKNEALAVLVGSDNEMRKKVLYNYDRIKGDAVTKEEINAKMREAHNMLGVSTTGDFNPINQAAGFQGGVSGGAQANQPAKVDSELAKNLGISDEDLKNSNLSKS